MFSIMKIFSRCRRNTRRTRYYYDPNVQPLAPILLRSPAPRVLTQIRFWDEGPFPNFPYMLQDEPLPHSDTSLSLPFTSSYDSFDTIPLDDGGRNEPVEDLPSAPLASASADIEDPNHSAVLPRDDIVPTLPSPSEEPVGDYDPYDIFSPRPVDDSGPRTTWGRKTLQILMMYKIVDPFPRREPPSGFRHSSFF